MASIILKGFGGLIPRLDPRNLPETAAQVATNVDLKAGTMAPVLDGLAETTVAAGTGTVYRWRYTDGAGAEQLAWLAYTGDVDICQGPIADDTYSRIYMTKTGIKPRMRYYKSATATEVDLEIQTPASAPVAADPTPPAFTWAFNSGTHSISPIEIARLSTYRTTFTVAGSFDVSAYGNGVLHTWPITLSMAYLGGTSTIIVANLNFLRGGVISLVWTDLNPESEGSKVTLSGNGYYLIRTLTTCKVNSANCPVDTSTDPMVISIDLTVDIAVEQQFTLAAWDGYYACTYVTDLGEEGPVSPISNLVKRIPGASVAISGIPAAGAGRTISKVRIYRTASGLETDAWRYVGEITAPTSPATGSFTDSVPDTGLGETLLASTNAPSGIMGLRVMPGGFFAAFKGKTIYFSEPYLPYSWPAKYRQTVDFEVVALGVQGSSLVVGTKGNPYLISGSHPGTMSVEQLSQPQACVSKLGMVNADGAVIYPSPDGLVGIIGGQAQLITEKVFKRADWQALTPTGMVATYHDNRVIAKMGTGVVYVFDFADGINAITTNDEAVTSWFLDIQTDTLFVLNGTAVTKWNAGAEPKMLEWKSKEFITPGVDDWSCARVMASAYPVGTGYSDNRVKLLLYSEGVLLATMVVTDETPFRLPVFRPENQWAVAVQAYNIVYEVRIGTSMKAIM